MFRTSLPRVEEPAVEGEGVNGSELSAADQKKKGCISLEELYEAVMDMVRLTRVYLGMVMLLPEDGGLLVFFGKVNQGLEKMCGPLKDVVFLDPGAHGGQHDLQRRPAVLPGGDDLPTVGRKCQGIDQGGVGR